MRKGKKSQGRKIIFDISYLEQDYYGILCDTAIKKQMVHSIKEFIKQMVHSIKEFIKNVD